MDILRERIKKDHRYKGKKLAKIRRQTLQEN
ncbi:Uncharacterised protein [Escherichia coli]|nr:Uncharacterised protein [Escherichia coli]CAD6109583.1 Uncharacterised protein [Escherichia coli]CAD6551598.1 Uncharacterised protein [Escherichia coli]